MLVRLRCLVLTLLLMVSVHPADAVPNSPASIKTASDGLSMRSLRRVGLGVSGAGPLGVFGVNLEMNFTSDVGILTGFGGGSDYQAFTVQMKRVLGGTSLMPYVAGGYARWYNFGKAGRIDSETTPGFLQTKFLSEKQKAEGRFSENLIYPALGLQHMTLSGPYAGSSVFAEVLMLIDINDFVVAPTGTVGYMYYF